MTYFWKKEKFHAEITHPRAKSQSFSFCYVQDFFFKKKFGFGLGEIIFRKAHFVSQSFQLN